MDLVTLRQKHPVFHYLSSSFELTEAGLELHWEFRLEPDLIFKPRLTLLGLTAAQIETLPKTVLDWYVFQIGLVEMLSYWKLACSPQIVIEAGQLSPEQQAWWHDLLIKGMGEFFFVNQIDFTPSDFVSIINGQEKTDVVVNSLDKTIKKHQNIQQDIQTPSKHRILLPIGGGKDSAVTLEILQHAGYDAQVASLLLLNPTLAAQNIWHQSDLPALALKRDLDPQLTRLNELGYLNGHTPFSALLAFVTNLVGYIYDFELVAVSNERSSNEGNVMFHQQEINHQYSKTYEFETKFRDYMTQYGPAEAPAYFSFLRPIYELQIAALFGPMTKYHEIFRSCNVGRQTNSWCGECAKCLFAFLILSAVLPIDEVIKIFGQNLFDNLDLLPIALEQLGYADQKPLECVGTREESQAAAYLVIQKYQQQSLPLPALLEKLQQDHLQHEADLAARAAAVLTAWNPEHHLPPDLEALLKTHLAQVTHATDS